MDRNIFNEKFSYVDIALEKSLKQFNLFNRLSELEEIVVLGSGNTTKRTCYALIAMGAKPESLTIIHRISCSSVQLDNIRRTPGLENIDFIRSKHGYHTDKVRNLALQADLLVCGIDTKSPVIDLPVRFKPFVIDFNSAQSCTFIEKADASKYLSINDLDKFVRDFSKEQFQDAVFCSKLAKAERFIEFFEVNSDEIEVIKVSREAMVKRFAAVNAA